MLSFGLSVLVFGLATSCLGQDAASDIPIVTDVAMESADVAKELISQLTLAMAAEVIDERTFAIRDATKGSKYVHLVLGNTGPTPRGSLEASDHEEKKKVAADALGKFVNKQMIWYKTAPDAVQSTNSSGTPVIFADVWSTDGRHIANFLKKEGHLSDEQLYDAELAKDIFSVAAEAEKKESYKKLEEALKENEKHKQEQAKAARAKEQEEEAAETESLGLSGWMATSMLLLIALGAATNFGRPSNKKANMNRKRGAWDRFWMKIKGS